MEVLPHRCVTLAFSLQIDKIMAFVRRADPRYAASGSGRSYKLL
jgi:hypothetical protein